VPKPKPVASAPVAGPSTSSAPPPASKRPSSSAPSIGLKPSKRPKFDPNEFAGEEFDEDAYEDLAASRSKGKAAAVQPSSGPMAAAGATGTAQPKKQIISSLFTHDHKSYHAGSSGGALPDALPESSAGAAKSLIAPSNAPSAAPTGGAAISDFSSLGLSPLLAHHLASKLAISQPTPIQRSALPTMLLPPPPTGASAQALDESRRDIFIQSQTGSGKTLTYLLPILQSLLPLSTQSYIDRSIGTLAIILVPTRELAKQIHDVLEGLLSLNLNYVAPGETEGPRYTRWLVSGLLTGGATRTHEKARIRKGLPILVSTPGRLLDHLQNTTSLDVAKLRWLVLDEADRLMDLGFAETLASILKSLDGRRKNAIQELGEGGRAGTVGGWDWDVERKTVLCSATVREDVQALAGQALRRPRLFRATGGEDVSLDELARRGKGKAVAAPVAAPSAPAIAANGAAAADADGDLGDLEGVEEEKFTPPSQLRQSYIITPPKLRLVTLVSLLRSLVAAPKKAAADAKPKKVIVFLSTTDSVDFHWKMLGGIGMGGAKEGEAEADDGDEAEDGDAVADSSDDDDSDEAEEKPQAGKGDKKGKKKRPRNKILDEPTSLTSVLLPKTTLHRLHGSLPLQTRLASLKAFADKAATESAVLFCTSVASRGLDMPLVRAVVQYDLPTEGGSTEYVHRIGRTARVGAGGEAWAFVGESEKDWVPWVEGKMGAVKINGVGMEGVLKGGFGGGKWEERATEVQGALERWVHGTIKVGPPPSPTPRS
jgi:ATP-dependent RNA helicase DDX31/DBP7